MCPQLGLVWCYCLRISRECGVPNVMMGRELRSSSTNQDFQHKTMHLHGQQFVAEHREKEKKASLSPFHLSQHSEALVVPTLPVTMQ